MGPDLCEIAAMSRVPLRDLRRRRMPCSCLAAASCGALVVAHSNIIGGGSNAGDTGREIDVTCDNGFSGSATSICTAVPGQTTSAWSTVTCAGMVAACVRLCLCGPPPACMSAAMWLHVQSFGHLLDAGRYFCVSARCRSPVPNPHCVGALACPPQCVALAVSAPAASSANHARRAPSPMSRKGRALRPAASAALSTRRPTPPTAAT